MSNAHDVAVGEAARVFEEIARGRRDAQGTRIVEARASSWPSRSVIGRPAPAIRISTPRW